MCALFVSTSFFTFFLPQFCRFVHFCPSVLFLFLSYELLMNFSSILICFFLPSTHGSSFFNLLVSCFISLVGSSGIWFLNCSCAIVKCYKHLGVVVLLQLCFWWILIWREGSIYTFYCFFVFSSLFRLGLSGLSGLFRLCMCVLALLRIDFLYFIMTLFAGAKEPRNLNLGWPLETSFSFCQSHKTSPVLNGDFEWWDTLACGIWRWMQSL